jgi:hypothetical protein
MDQVEEAAASRAASKPGALGATLGTPVTREALSEALWAESTTPVVARYGPGALSRPRVRAPQRPRAAVDATVSRGQPRVSRPPAARALP